MFTDETYDKFNTPEVGDVFAIKLVKGQKKPCRYPNKKFTIKKISKSKEIIYYDDLRTNIKCQCFNCQPHISRLSSKNKHTEKSIHITKIEIIEKKDQYQRNLKLKLLNI